MNAIPSCFTGEYEHTLDAVNRLVIPAKWRTGQSEEFFILVRNKSSLSVLPRAELEKIVQRIDSNPTLSNSEKRERRQIFSSAMQVTCDKQGRITMAADLLKKIAIKNVVVFVGGVERFEIWDPETWKQRQSERAVKRAAILEELGI